MKRPKTVTMKPQFPTSRALEAGKKMLAVFAHHVPTIVKANAHMDRPRGGKGPRN